MKRCKIIRTLKKTYRRRALMAAERKHWMRNRRPAFIRRQSYRRRLAKLLVCARLRMFQSIEARRIARMKELNWL